LYGSNLRRGAAGLHRAVDGGRSLLVMVTETLVVAARLVAVCTSNLDGHRKLEVVWFYREHHSFGIEPLAHG